MSITILPTRSSSVSRKIIQNQPKTFNLWIRGLDIQGAIEAGLTVTIRVSPNGTMYEYTTENPMSTEGPG